MPGYALIIKHLNTKNHQQGTFVKAVQCRTCVCIEQAIKLGPFKGASANLHRFTTSSEIIVSLCALSVPKKSTTVQNTESELCPSRTPPLLVASCFLVCKSMHSIPIGVEKSCSNWEHQQATQIPSTTQGRPLWQGRRPQWPSVSPVGADEGLSPAA